MAGPVFEAVAESSSSSDTSSCVVTIPTHNSGDVLVVVMSNTASGAAPAPGFTVPTRWTRAVARNAGSSSAVRCSGFYTEGDGVATSVTFTPTADTSFAAFCAVYSNAEASHDQNAQTGQSAGVDIASPSITTTVTDSKVIFAYVFDDNISTDADHDSDAGFLGTSRGYQEFGDSGHNGLATAMSDYDKATAGATGTCTWSSNGDNDAGVAISFNIKKAAVPDALLADDVESTSSVSIPDVGQEHVLTANDTESTTELTTPSVGQSHVLLADDTQSNTQISVPDVGQEHTLLADNTESNTELTTPAVGQEHVLLADNTESNTELTVPDLGVVHNLLANDTEGSTELTTPDIGQEHSLSAGDVQSNTQASSPSLGQEHTLLADNVVSITQVSVPNPGQEHGLTADDVESGTEASTPAVGQEHALNANDAEANTELTTPTLAEVSGSVHNLLADDLVSVTQVAVPNVGQEHVLLANNVESTTTLSEPTLDRPVVVPITTSSSGGFFSPSQKDIDRLVAVFDKTSKKKRKKLQRIKRLEEAAVKVLATDTNKALAQDAVKTINFVQMLEDTEQDYRRKRAEELLNQAAALVREIEREEEDILFLVANPVRPPKKAPFIDNEEDVFLLLAA